MMLHSRRLTLLRIFRRENLRFLSEAASSETANETEDNYTQEKENLYEGHEPTSALQRGLLMVGSALAALNNPTRSDMVAILGETTGYAALQKLHKQMIADPVGSRILKERPLINTKTIDMQRLRSLPDGTFGKEYTKYMDGCEISADTRDPVRFVDDKELAYVMLRYRQLHDFTHLLTGFPSVTVPAEIAVKWFEMFHFGLPMCALSATVAPVILTSSERALLRKEVIPWALYAGCKSKLFLNVYFEEHFEKDINELRREIKLTPCDNPFK